jgi:hypothetical protein
MSLGGNFSSGYTQNLINNSITCSIPKSQALAHTDKCCDTENTIVSQSASYPSMVILSKVCPPPTPAEFAKFPKVAVPSSVRTASLVNRNNCPKDLNPISRFAHYDRYQVPVPCPPLPASANMAGKPLPSSRQCNL